MGVIENQWAIRPDYDGLFETEEEKQIAAKINQRRRQMLVHSCIYYRFCDGIITDAQWDEWARELVKLQNTYPSIAEKMPYADAFRGWDASSGFNLPYSDADVMRKASWLLEYTKQKGRISDD